MSGLLFVAQTNHVIFLHHIILDAHTPPHILFCNFLLVCLPYIVLEDFFII